MSARFSDYVELLDRLLDLRSPVVEAIERRLLNVQDKDTSRRRDRAYFEQLFKDTVFSALGIGRDRSALPAALAAAHASEGFRLGLRQVQRLDPIELLIRGYDEWAQFRWPGRNGRLAFAQVLFSAFVFAQLELLSLRIWDDGGAAADDRLQAVQRLLERLNGGGSCRFVRDARWLIQTAQGALTTELAPYFTVAGRVATTLTTANQLEVHRAGAVLAGGHLRSQQFLRAREAGLDIDHPEVLAITRNSNAIDAALLVADLVPLLDAYRGAVETGEGDQRLRLAEAILQGLSADPELLLNRLDLLEAATAIEEVFLAATATEHTAAGARHVALVARYAESIGRTREPLADDAIVFDPEQKPYSPFGIRYGFCADLLWTRARSTLAGHPPSELTLEDLFESRNDLETKAAVARAWARLPHEGAEHEDCSFSATWALEAFDNVRRRLGRPHGSEATGRLVLLPEGLDRVISLDARPAQEHLVTSDVQRALAEGSTAFPKSHFLADRKEGRYLASVEVEGKWFAVSKVVLTTHLARGENAIIVDVPAALIERLRLTAPGLVEVPAAASGIAS